MNIFWLMATILPYLALVAYLGLKGYNETKNSADYMVGGRNIHPYVMAMSYGATFISTSAIVGFGGIASLFGMSMLWLPVLNIGVGVIIAFIFFGKRTRKMGLMLNAHTFPELLSKRVDSRFVQASTGAVIFVFMPLYTAAVLIGASRILEGLLNIPYIYSVAIFSVLVAVYVIMGGLKGVMYTDALQGTLMFGGMIILLFFIYMNLGGIVDAHHSLSQMSSLIPEALQKGGIYSWTGSAKFNSPLWWTIYSSIILGVGIGVLAQPQLVVRFMTVKSNKEINRAVAIGSVFILVTVGTSFIVGALSNVYFMNTTGKISIALAGGNADKVIPLFINQALPGWFGYLFMLVILSAAMSTLSSQYHVIGTSIGRDFYEKGISKNPKKGREILINRIGILISILATVFLSLKLGDGVIATATAIFFGLMASCYLAPYIASLYWKNFTKQGMIAGIVSGFITSIFCFLFIHAKEAAVFGLCKAITGKVTLFQGVINFVDPMVIALPVSVLFTVGVTLLTKDEKSRKIADKLF